MCEEKETPVTEEVEQEVEQAAEEVIEVSAEDLAAKVEVLEKTLGELQEQYTRMLAEYANYKRRTEQEKEQIGSFSKADVLAKLLPVIDDLDRAADAPDGPDYRKGVDMIVDKFHAQLEKLGLTEIPAQGEPFDPEVHHAVMREDADGVEPDTVTEVFQKGYRFGERVVRPAMVRVAN